MLGGWRACASRGMRQQGSCHPTEANGAPGGRQRRPTGGSSAGGQPAHLHCPGDAQGAVLRGLVDLVGRRGAQLGWVGAHGPRAVGKAEPEARGGARGDGERGKGGEPGVGGDLGDVGGDEGHPVGGRHDGAAHLARHHPLACGVVVQDGAGAAHRHAHGEGGGVGGGRLRQRVGHAPGEAGDGEGLGPAAGSARVGHALLVVAAARRAVCRQAGSCGACRASRRAPGDDVEEEAAVGVARLCLCAGVPRILAGAAGPGRGWGRWGRRERVRGSGGGRRGRRGRGGPIRMAGGVLQCAAPRILVAPVGGGDAGGLCRGGGMAWAHSGGAQHPHSDISHPQLDGRSAGQAGRQATMQDKACLVASSNKDRKKGWDCRTCMAYDTLSAPSALAA